MTKDKNMTTAMEFHISRYNRGLAFCIRYEDLEEYKKLLPKAKYKKTKTRCNNKIIHFIEVTN